MSFIVPITVQRKVSRNFCSPALQLTRNVIKSGSLPRRARTSPGTANLAPEQREKARPPFTGCGHGETESEDGDRRYVMGHCVGARAVA